MNTNYLIEWILKQSGLKVVFFVQYIDHVQTLRIGFASIWKEDILLVSLLKTSFFTNRMSSFHFRARHIRNVWTWSYTVNTRSFQPWRDHQEGFSNQKRMLLEEWRYQKRFSIGLLWQVEQNSSTFNIS